MIQNRRFIYILLPLFGLALLANALIPNIVLAARIPFAIQNVTQSSPEDLVGGLYHLVTLLPQRDDGKFYQGVVTYTSSDPVEVNVLQPLVENASARQPLTVPGLNASISALGFQEPQYFNTVPFAGSEVVLIHRSPHPFTAAYSIVGELVDPEPLPK
jgi:hypothetical protein